MDSTQKGSLDTMNILIIGCGRLGSRLASVLDLQGHDIVVIESDPERLNQLDDGFDGLMIQGNPIDLDVMKSAGIEGCDYVLCLSPNDNQNLMASQIARNIFHVQYIQRSYGTAFISRVEPP